MRLLLFEKKFSPSARIQTHKQYSTTSLWVESERAKKKYVRAHSFGNDDENNRSDSGNGDDVYNDVVDDKTTISNKYDAIKPRE